MKEIHPELLKRKIIHVDMDAFFAAVEVLDNPALAGLPLVIGGSPQSRSVVCTASYEARKFGIRSAMACSKAYRLCPDAIFIKPRHDRYQEVSRQIFKIYTRYAQKIEPVSLDEAYLDVTEETSQAIGSFEEKTIDNFHNTDAGESLSATELTYHPDDDEFLEEVETNFRAEDLNLANKIENKSVQSREIYTSALKTSESLSAKLLLESSFLKGTPNNIENASAFFKQKKKLTSATEIARAIKADILAEIGLTASAGVAPNKMLAKLASDYQKPNGLTVIRPVDVAAFMHKLAVKKIHGIGPVSAKKLESIGIITCADIYRFRKMDLYEKIGPRFAEWLWDHGMGISRSQVSRDHERKSLGSENTFREDLSDFTSLQQELKIISADVFRRMKKRRLLSSHLTLKIKYSDFSVQSRSLQIPTPFASEEQILSYAYLLLKKGLNKPVRLLGISLTHLEEQTSDSIPFQASLNFDC